MSNGSFRRALLDADRDLARVPFVDERGMCILVTARRRMPWQLPAIVLAGAAVLVFLLLTRTQEPERTRVAGFELDAPTSSWRTAGNALEVLAASLDVHVPGFGHLVAERGTRVVRIDGGVHVLYGRVEVDVFHRAQWLAPALVQVSHGTIAVLGTRFTIVQGARSGHVMLHEGQIRFDGERNVLLAAGASLSWPLAPIAEPAPPPSAPPPSAPPQRRRPSHVENKAAAKPLETAVPAPVLDVDRMIAEVTNLRVRRRFADAAALLERTLAADLPAATLERLSYELGDILTYQLADSALACSHWHSHRSRFPQGRYTDEVSAAVRRLGCEESTP